MRYRGTEVQGASGAYRIDGLLGSGAVATVYAARAVVPEGVGPWVAIKVLHSDSDRLERRMLREARAQVRIVDPHVVPVLDVVRLDEHIALVMPYAGGGSIADLLDRAPRGLPVDPWLEIADGVLHGVAAAHAAHVVHRDLKPDNLLLAHFGGRWQVQVTDFGLAKLLADEGIEDVDTTHGGEVMGTPPFMAPEQTVDASQVTPASDVFSLATTLYAVAIGRSPFLRDDTDATMARIRGHAPPFLGRRRPHIPDALADIVHVGLAKDPALRWPDAGAMRAAWRDALTPEQAAVAGHLQPPGHVGQDEPGTAAS